MKRNRKTAALAIAATVGVCGTLTYQFLGAHGCSDGA
jgi:hypothetical protein